MNQLFPSMAVAARLTFLRGVKSSSSSRSAVLVLCADRRREGDEEGEGDQLREVESLELEEHQESDGGGCQVQRELGIVTGDTWKLLFWSEKDLVDMRKLLKAYTK